MLQGFSDQQIVPVVLIPDHIPSRQGCFVEIIKQLLLFQWKLLKTRNPVAQYPDVGKLVGDYFESFWCVHEVRIMAAKVALSRELMQNHFLNNDKLFENRIWMIIVNLPKINLLALLLKNLKIIIKLRKNSDIFKMNFYEAGSLVSTKN
jgi:hypothetical protein